MKAYDNLGLTLDALGEPQHAVEAFRRAIELNEQLKTISQWPYLNLGEILLRQNQYSESISYFQKALDIDPNWAKARTNLGKAILKAGRIHEAKTQFLEAIRLDPASSEAHYQLGQLYRNVGEIEACQQQLRIFQELKGKSAPNTLSDP